MTPTGNPSLFALARPGRAGPYEADGVTLRDPARQAFVRLAALEG